MKKFLFALTIFTLFTLAACKEQDPTCEDGQSLVDGVCTTDSSYDDRSLVTDECVNLENIDDWQPVWCEEFDYTGLPDSEKWFYDTGGSGFGNNELQYYTDSDLDNASVSDGTLKITALKEDYLGSDYTSARLVSKYRGDFLYGRFEIRAKMPTGRGTWAAAWMLPTNYSYGGWPNSGEIDIMEYVGYDVNRIYGTIHTAAYNHNLGTQIGYSKTIQNAETEFHIYELIWEPAYMEVLVDGVSYGQFGYNPLYNIGIENSDAWPFDDIFHIILNVAIGGDWGGSRGVDDTIFPTTMEIDYVRVYQKDYAGMDQTAPETVTNVSLLDTSSSTLQFMWTHAVDDVKVKEYEIYANGELVETTTVNGLLLTGLEQDTSYTIEIVSVDFADRKSNPATVTFTTDTVRSIDGVIEAESYDNQSGVVREDTTDVSGVQHVAWIDTNDYMEYTLYVPVAGTYSITYRIASDNSGEIKLYGKTVVPLTTTTFSSTGEADTWTDITSSTFTLQEGVYTFKIKATDGGFKLNYFTFTLHPTD